jgi:hypothetical protein
VANYEINFRFWMTFKKKENLAPNTSFPKYLSQNGGNFQKNHQYPLSSSSQGHALCESRVTNGINIDFPPLHRGTRHLPLCWSTFELKRCQRVHKPILSFLSNIFQTN